MKHIRVIVLLAIPAFAIGALAWAQLPDGPFLPAQARADLVVVEKGKHRLTLYARGKPLAAYRVSLGRDPRGAKRQEGDHRTPEGRYVIDFRKADSAYFRALHISYPDRAEVAAARARGVAPGGAVMIHGMRNGLGWLGKLHRFVDWTDGCVAVTDREMREIWRAVPDGTPIELKP